METKHFMGHAAAIASMFIWGTTFISSKILLEEFLPIEVLLMRFILGFAVLCIAGGKPLKGTTWKEEGLFALAGLSGISIYYLLENIALTYTYASNIGVITSSAPFFTVILLYLFYGKSEKPDKKFAAGFITAMAGISLISFNGSSLHLNPFGDLLALLAASTWGFYSVFTRKLSEKAYPTAAVTRRIFFYGILFMLPIAGVSGFFWRPELILKPVNLINLLFLGLGASAFCFAAWNYAVKMLGAVQTSVYIYMIPVVTVATSALVLKEQMTVYTGIGTLLTLAGLAVSEGMFSNIISRFHLYKEQKL